MWGTFTNYLSQYYGSNETTTQDNETDGPEGWVLIDKDGNEIEKTNPQTEPSSQSRLSPLPLLDISNTSSPQSSPQLSPTKIEEGWFVAPPPCFTVNCPGQIEISPLEDLLIEHPSMSVYSHPDFAKDRMESIENSAYDSISTFAAEDLMEPDKHSSSNAFSPRYQEKSRRVASLEYPSLSLYAGIPRLFAPERRAESVDHSNLSVYDGISSLFARTESAERLSLNEYKLPCLVQKERKVKSSSLDVYSQAPKFQAKNKKVQSIERLRPYDRPEEVVQVPNQSENSENAEARTYEPRIAKKNPLAKAKTCTKANMAGTRNPIDLKGFLDQRELTKPAQQAKWESDQFKLCPSYLSRQNRVHQYQSRKNHNQKKKSIAKPFAEKGGHGF